MDGDVRRSNCGIFCWITHVYYYSNMYILIYIYMGGLDTYIYIYICLRNAMNTIQVGQLSTTQIYVYLSFYLYRYTNGYQMITEVLQENIYTP